MTSRLVTGLVGAAALGCAVNGGVFFAFSTFVMPALAKLPGDGGADAMRAINEAVLKSAFMPLFLGTAVLCVAACLPAIVDVQPLRLPALAGAALFLVGCVVVTLCLNVPLNDSLAARGGGTAVAWSTYLSDWTWWNTVRCVCCIAASGALLWSTDWSGGRAV